VKPTGRVFKLADELEFVSTEGYELPKLDTKSSLTILEEGTYVQQGGLDISVGEGVLSVVKWDGEKWSKEKDLYIPQDVGGEIEPNNERAVSGDTVARWALNKYSERALPEGYEFIELDRPDLTDLSILTLVDKDMRVIPLFPGMDGSLFVTNDYDR